jgi:hypothetical protein
VVVEKSVVCNWTLVVGDGGDAVIMLHWENATEWLKNSVNIKQDRISECLNIMLVDIEC